MQHVSNVGYTGRVPLTPERSGPSRSLLVSETVLAAEWADAERASDSVTSGSGYKALWRCAAGHEWRAPVYSRAAGRGCPVCANKVTVPGVNDLRTTHPDLAEQWADTDRDVSLVNAGSHHRALWKCDKGHTWRTSVESRVRGGYGCAVCTNRIVVSGVNDLGTTHPALAVEWDDPRDISTVSSGSGYNARWKCSEGHSWRVRVVAREAGRGCRVCAGQEVLPGFNDLLTTRPDLAAEWADPDVAVSTVSKGANYNALWACPKGHTWRAPVYSRNAGNGCPSCDAVSYSSKFEKEIALFVESLVGSDAVQRTARGVVGGRTELDVYVPDRQVAIEANGVFWHSERSGKDRTYHRAKWDACARAGIQLIQVWEDDWKYRRKTVERLLAHKLGRSGPAIAARKTVAERVPMAEVRDFLEEHHIQGFTVGTHYLGLRAADGTLEAAMVLKKSRGRTLVLERYATASRVIGGHSKLVRYAEREIPSWDELVTFADLEVSDGNLYETTGWVKDGEVPPDYKYVVRDRRVHKFNYRLKRFRDDPALTFEEGRSERELAALNGLDRVWDSGKVRYRYARQSL